MFWMQFFAGLWMLVSCYLAFALVNQKQRLEDVDAMVAELEEQDFLLKSMSPNSLLGCFTAFHVLVAGFDFLGFALAYTYLPLHGPLLWIFIVIVGCYILDILQDFVHVRKLQRMFFQLEHPYPVIARYLRYCVTMEGVSSYVSVYGKCLVAVNLFLSVI